MTGCQNSPTGRRRYACSTANRPLAISDGEQPAAEAEQRERRELRRARRSRGRARGTAGRCRTARRARRRRRWWPRTSGTKRPRRELEQQQLDREHDRGERRAERGRHAGRGAAGEEDLALVGRHVDDLAEQRAERPAGDDDRALGAERAAGADGDRRRQRLGDAGAGRDPALSREHRLHRLGDAVAADDRRPLGHQGHDAAPPTAATTIHGLGSRVRRSSAASSPTGGTGTGS